MNAEERGNGLRAIPFKHIYCADFEFQAGRGNRPKVVCLVVHEVRSRETRSYWQDELYRMPTAPFTTGDDSCLVAYAAQAEIGCFLSLGWPLPVNVIDLYAEFRVETNGARRTASLIDALALHNLPHMDAATKESMRDLVLRVGDWSEEERSQILRYCQSDVEATVALLLSMAASLDLPRASLRGRFAIAVAAMEHAGIPVDLGQLRRIRRKWPRIRKDLIAEVDAGFGVYDGETFKRDRFSRWLHHRRIPWPRLESGLLALSDKVFEQQEAAWPVITPLRDLRKIAHLADLDGLQVGPDARARTSLRPFSSVTGRNQPSTTKFAFGTAKWMRGFIAPSDEVDLAYIDFTSQEIGIAAGLSGDERLIAAYIGGDIYLSFARDAGLVPEGATKESHPEVRNACKVVVLGLGYGMGPDSMALQAAISVAMARHLITLHKRTYRAFWKWSDDMVDAALLSRRMRTVFGWSRRMVGGEKINSIRNFPMQANGAEMMRIAAIGGISAGIELCAPVHDAFLIAAPPNRLDHDVETMRAIMTKAGEVVCGVPIRTEAKLIRYPSRYMEDRGVNRRSTGTPYRHPKGTPLIGVLCW
ncbi:DNA polymerase [Bradyrhizobium septentrionale]|uniref:DNA-directed DNA polymerase n=1 Tax=Bradyrhizobium septentrionale TaxID=1404411 RepID=A0ABZ2NYM9_9BRAD